jgi:hypothetical protein
MNTEVHSTQERIAVSQDADHDELVDAVAQLAEEVSDLRDEVSDLRDDKARLEDEVSDLETQLNEEQDLRGKQVAQTRKDVADLSDAVDDLEEGKSPGTNPTPQAEETASSEPLTPIERLSEGNREDVAANVTSSVERAVALFENLPDWGTSTPKGTTLRPADRPKDLLEAATGESLAWQQYYRACEALESLSKGAVTFIDHRRHGKTVVMHDDTAVHHRATETTPGDSRPSLAAD